MTRTGRRRSPAEHAAARPTQDLPHRPCGPAGVHRRGRRPLVRCGAATPRATRHDHRHEHDQAATVEQFGEVSPRSQRRRLRAILLLPALRHALPDLQGQSSRTRLPRRPGPPSCIWKPTSTRRRTGPSGTNADGPSLSPTPARAISRTAATWPNWARSTGTPFRHGIGRVALTESRRSSW